MIRRAVAVDAKEIVEIYKPYVEDSPVSFEEVVPDVSEMAARIEEVGSKFPWLVEEREGRVVGFAYASPHRTRASYRWSTECSVYVHPDYRKQGLARALYREVFDHLRQRGYLNVYAGITIPNEPSEALHKAMGFRLVGTYEKVGYKLGRWHDVRWYAPTLAPHPAHPSVPG